jgi:hypothetical protein
MNVNLCIGQAYENIANMAGHYEGVQAILLERNTNCIFRSFGNCVFNLVRADGVE